MSVIRTFRAASVREALALVRAELGDEALILGQREVRSRSFPWRKAKVQMEVTAAIAGERWETRQRDAVPHTTHHKLTPLAVTTETIERSWPKQPASAAEAGSFRHEQLIRPRQSGTTKAPASAGQAFAAEPTSMVGGRHPSVAASPVSDDPFHVYTRLIEQDLHEDIARLVVGEAQKTRSRLPQAHPTVTDRCRQLITQSVRCSGGVRVLPGRRRIAALVGPTGVGKTTTVAKLAANFRLRDRLRVGLVTVDTFRVAAVEQLRTYAELIDVPMHVVTSPREMPTALDDLAEMDLVLIDTAGRSPSDDLKIQELRSFLQAAHADEVHLVASLTAGLRSFALTVERFRQVGPTSLLLTKLDEAAGPGAIVSAAWEAALPLSYITTGQDVPDDIETADPDVIAQRVLPAGCAASAAEDEFHRPRVGAIEMFADDVLPERGA